MSTNDPTFNPDGVNTRELLSESQKARLTKLSEECSEVIKAAMKILNYGPYAEYKGVRYNNLADLEKEIGQVFCAAHLMTRKGDISHAAIMEEMVRKKPEMISMIPHERDDDHLLSPTERP